MDSQKTVKKAVIAAAGAGTRFLPLTKTIPKEMLPIINKPVIQMIVEDIVAAGVEEIMIVTAPTKGAIEAHFSRNTELEDELVRRAKPDDAELIKDIAGLANFTFINQTGEPKGNARPIINAADFIADEPFFFFFADDFFTGEVPASQQLLEAYQKTGTSVVALMKVPEDQVGNYGIADVSAQIDDTIVQIRDIDEKPSLQDAKSHLAVSCGYLLDTGAVPIIKQEKLGADGEMSIAYAVKDIADQRGMHGVVIQGDYHDTGRPASYIKTMIDIALDDPDMGEEIRDYLRNRL